MAEMELTVEQVADALGLAPFTIAMWCKRKKFPRAYLLHGSRKFGYRIPIGDVLDYAATQSPALVERVQNYIDGLQARCSA